MKKIISLTILLFSFSTYSYSQYDFGFSKSNFISKNGVPDNISGDVLVYLKTDSSLNITMVGYSFNEYGELYQVIVKHMFSDCYSAKEKSNQLLKNAKISRKGGVIDGGYMLFGDTTIYPNIGYRLKLNPEKMGKLCYAEETFISLTHM